VAAHARRAKVRFRSVETSLEPSAEQRRARRLSTVRVEIAIEIVHVAHARDTTLEKTKPRPPRDDRGLSSTTGRPF